METCGSVHLCVVSKKEYATFLIAIGPLYNIKLTILKDKLKNEDIPSNNDGSKKDDMPQINNDLKSEDDLKMKTTQT